jgi:hypothetical protein
MSTIAVKKVDPRLYRRVKALASLKGKTVSEAVNEALEIWVELAAGSPSAAWERLEEDAQRDNTAYARHEAELLANHPGSFVAVAAGRILGTYPTPEEASEAVREARTTHGIVTKIEKKKEPKTLELGWGIMERLARESQRSTSKKKLPPPS